MFYMCSNGVSCPDGYDEDSFGQDYYEKEKIDWNQDLRDYFIKNEEDNLDYIIHSLNIFQLETGIQLQYKDLYYNSFKHKLWKFWKKKGYLTDKQVKNCRTCDYELFKQRQQNRIKNLPF